MDREWRKRAKIYQKGEKVEPGEVTHVPEARRANVCHKIRRVQHGLIKCVLDNGKKEATYKQLQYIPIVPFPVLSHHAS